MKVFETESEITREKIEDRVRKRVKDSGPSEKESPRARRERKIKDRVRMSEREREIPREE